MATPEDVKKWEEQYGASVPDTFYVSNDSGEIIGEARYGEGTGEAIAKGQTLYKGQDGNYSAVPYSGVSLNKDTGKITITVPDIFANDEYISSLLNKDMINSLSSNYKANKSVTYQDPTAPDDETKKWDTSQFVDYLNSTLQDRVNALDATPKAISSLIESFGGTEEKNNKFLGLTTENVITMSANASGENSNDDSPLALPQWLIEAFPQVQELGSFSNGFVKKSDFINNFYNVSGKITTDQLGQIRDATSSALQNLEKWDSDQIARNVAFGTFIAKNDPEMNAWDGFWTKVGSLAEGWNAGLYYNAARGLDTLVNFGAKVMSFATPATTVASAVGIAPRNFQVKEALGAGEDGELQKWMAQRNEYYKLLDQDGWDAFQAGYVAGGVAEQAVELVLQTVLTGEVTASITQGIENKAATKVAENIEREGDIALKTPAAERVITDAQAKSRVSSITNAVGKDANLWNRIFNNAQSIYLNTLGGTEAVMRMMTLPQVINVANSALRITKNVKMAETSLGLISTIATAAIVSDPDLFNKVISSEATPDETKMWLTETAKSAVEFEALGLITGIGTKTLGRATRGTWVESAWNAANEGVSKATTKATTTLSAPYLKFRQWIINKRAVAESLRKAGVSNRTARSAQAIKEAMVNQEVDKWVVEQPTASEVAKTERRGSTIVDAATGAATTEASPFRKAQAVGAKMKNLLTNLDDYNARVAENISILTNPDAEPVASQNIHEYMDANAELLRAEADAGLLPKETIRTNKSLGKTKEASANLYMGHSQVVSIYASRSQDLQLATNEAIRDRLPMDETNEKWWDAKTRYDNAAKNVPDGVRRLIDDKLLPALRRSSAAIIDYGLDKGVLPRAAITGMRADGKWGKNGVDYFPRVARKEEPKGYYVPRSGEVDRDDFIDIKRDKILEDEDITWAGNGINRLIEEIAGAELDKQLVDTAKNVKGMVTEKVVSGEQTKSAATIKEYKSDFQNAVYKGIQSFKDDLELTEAVARKYKKNAIVKDPEAFEVAGELEAGESPKLLEKGPVILAADIEHTRIAGLNSIDADVLRSIMSENNVPNSGDITDQESFNEYYSNSSDSAKKLLIENFGETPVRLYRGQPLSTSLSYNDISRRTPVYGNGYFFSTKRKIGAKKYSDNVISVSFNKKDVLSQKEFKELFKKATDFVSKRIKYPKLVEKAKRYKTLERFKSINNPIKGSEIWGDKPKSIFERDSRAVRVNMFPNDTVRGAGITKQYLLNLFKDAYAQGITNIVPSYGSYTKDGASFMDHLAEQGWIKSNGKNGYKSYEIAPKITEWKEADPLADIYLSTDKELSSVDRIDDGDSEKVELLEQMAMGYVPAFAKYSGKPVVETTGGIGDMKNYVYYNDIDEAVASNVESQLQGERFSPTEVSFAKLSRMQNSDSSMAQSILDNADRLNAFEMLPQDQKNILSSGEEVNKGAEAFRKDYIYDMDFSYEAAETPAAEGEKKKTKPGDRLKYEINEDLLLQDIDDAIDAMIDTVLIDSKASLYMQSANTLAGYKDTAIRTKFYVLSEALSSRNKDVLAKTITYTARNIINSAIPKKRAVIKGNLDSLYRKAEKLMKDRMVSQLADAKASLESIGESADSDTVSELLKDLNTEIMGYEQDDIYIKTTDNNGETEYYKVSPAFGALYNSRPVYKPTSTPVEILATLSLAKRISTTNINPRAFSKQAASDTAISFATTGAITAPGMYGILSKELENRFGGAIAAQIEKNDPYRFNNIKIIADREGISLGEAYVRNANAISEAHLPFTTMTQEVMRQAGTAKFGVDYQNKAAKKGVVGKINGALSRASETLGKPNDVREMYTRKVAGVKEQLWALDHGYNYDQAEQFRQYAVDNATTNFRNKHTILNGLRMTTPYLTSGMSGAKSFWRMFELDPLGVTSRIITGFVVPIIYFIGEIHDDEQLREQYRNLAEYEKKDHIIISVGGQLVRIPVGEELGNIVNPITHMVEGLYGENKYEFWRLMLDDLVGLNPVGDLTGFTEPELYENIAGQAPSFLEIMDNGVSTLLSSTMPPLLQSVYMATSGRDLYTGKKVDTSKVHIDEDGNAVISSYSQSEFAKGVANIIGGDARVIEKITSGIFGTTMLHVLDTITSAIDFATSGGEKGSLLTGGQKFIGDVTSPYATVGYDSLERRWSQEAARLFEMKREIEYGDAKTNKYIAYNNEISKTQDPTKRKELISKRNALLTEYQNRVEAVIKGYRDAGGSLNGYKFSTALSLLTFEDALRADRNFLGLNTQYLDARNQAMQTLYSYGITNPDGPSMLGYIYYDDKGQDQVKLWTPAQMQIINNVYCQQGTIHQSRIKAIIEDGSNANSVKTLKKSEEAAEQPYWDKYNSTGKLSNAEWNKIDELRKAYNSQVVLAIKDYIDSYGADYVLSDETVMDYLENIVKVPSEYEKVNNRYISSGSGKLNKQQGFARSYIKEIFGVR